MPNWKSSFAFCLVSVVPTVAWAQVVQLPTVGSFNLSTSIAVPDSGSVGLGGLGAGVGRSSSLGGGQVSVHATVIDLAELDSMIRSQSGKTPAQPHLHSSAPKPHYSTQPRARSRMRDADYDYLLALSRNGQVVESKDSDAVTYYLGLAERSRFEGNWNAVELYYKLAWDHLSPARREAALRDLAQARTPRENKPDPSNRSSKPR